MKLIYRGQQQRLILKEWIDFEMKRKVDFCNIIISRFSWKKTTRPQADFKSASFCLIIKHNLSQYF